MAGSRGGVSVVQLKADDQKAQGQRADEREHADQRRAVLTPGDPGHPSPRNGRRSRILFTDEGADIVHCHRGHLVTSDDSASRARAGPGSAAAPGSRK